MRTTNLTKIFFQDPEQHLRVGLLALVHYHISCSGRRSQMEIKSQYGDPKLRGSDWRARSGWWQFRGQVSGHSPDQPSGTATYPRAYSDRKSGMNIHDRRLFDGPRNQGGAPRTSSSTAGKHCGRNGLLQQFCGSIFPDTHSGKEGWMEGLVELARSSRSNLEFSCIIPR